jgi:hypothetical protein
MWQIIMHIEEKEKKLAPSFGSLASPKSSR